MVGADVTRNPQRMIKPPIHLGTVIMISNDEGAKQIPVNAEMFFQPVEAVSLTDTEGKSVVVLRDTSDDQILAE